MDTPYAQYARLTNTIEGETKLKIAIGELLYNLRRDESWRGAVGEGVDTWDQFLRQPEISISRLEADRLIKIYELTLSYDNDTIELVPYKNLKRLIELPNITDDLINQAMNLSDRDFKEAIVENQNIQERTYKYMVMKKCLQTGNMTKVHGIDSDIIKTTFDIND